MSELSDKLYGLEEKFNQLRDELDDIIALLDEDDPDDDDATDLMPVSGVVADMTSRLDELVSKWGGSSVGPFNEAEAQQREHGSVLPNSNWPNWQHKYAQGEMIAFIPFDFGGWRAKESEGNKYFEVSVNGAQYLLKLNEVQEVPAGVFHFYQNAVQAHKDAEMFKRNGPEHAPWSHAGPGDRKSTWHYEPSVPTFGIDIDGRYMSSDTDYILLDDNGRPSPTGVPCPIPPNTLLQKRSK